MDRTINLAVIDAAGLAAEALMEVLVERSFPVENLYLLGKEGDEGLKQFYKEKAVELIEVDTFDFSTVELVICLGEAQWSQQYIEQAASAGAVVVDASGAFADDSDVPMVVAGVNDQALAEVSIRNIVSAACPISAAVLQLVGPIYRQVGVKHLNISAYQSVSVAGKKGVDELAGQTAALLNARDPQTSVFEKQVAFNLLSQSGEVDDNGFCQSEVAVISNIQKVLADDYLSISPTCVVVPMFYGHGIALQIETQSPFGAWEARDLFADIDGVKLISADEVVTPVSDVTGKNELFVSRIRANMASETNIDLFVLADNVRHGKVVNSVKIAEQLITQYI